MNDRIAALNISSGIAFHPKRVKSSIRVNPEHILCTLGVFFCSMVYFRYGDLNFTVSDTLFFACFGLLLLNGKISLWPFGKMTVVLWMSGLFLMLAGLTFAGLFSADPMRGLIVVGQYAFAYFVGLVIFGGRSLDEIVALSKAYVFSIVVICLHGIYLIHYDGQLFTVFVTGNGRFAGLMERTNECATVIALSVPILLVLTTMGHVKKPVAFVMFGVLTYGILLTGSNTGLFSLLYGLGIFAFIGVPWRRLLLPLVVVVLLIPLGGTSITDSLPVAFQKRVLGALESGDLGQAGTFDGRLELIYEALEMTDQTALVGIGPDQYRLNSVQRAPVHNLYLLLWTEGGFISAFGFLVMLLGALGCAVAVLARKGGNPFAAAIFANVTMFMFAVNALPHVYSRFWVVPIVLPMALAMYWLKTTAGASESRTIWDQSESADQAKFLRRRRTITENRS